jgi:MoaA/NifB/PqqE/SkfB family radical SAM enzyme
MSLSYSNSNHTPKKAWRLFRNFIFRDRPFFAHLFLTKRCNLRCIYCKLWQSPREQNEMSTTEWFEAIDRLDKLGVHVISFTGGEPLLRQDSFDIIKYANSKGLYTRITSNGTLNLSVYQKLLDTGINSISISIDSINPEIQESLSQVKDSWYKAIDNLKFLIKNSKAYQVISASSVLTSYNINEALSLVDYCSDVLNCPISLQPAIFGDCDNSDFFFRPNRSDVNAPKVMAEDTEKIYQLLYRKKYSSRLMTTNSFLRISQKYLRDGEYKWNCKAGRLFFDIMPDGRLFLCQDVPFPDERYILDTDFVSWFKSKAYQKTAKRVSSTCIGCCYSCYIYSQHIFSWHLLGILATAFSTNIYGIYRFMFPLHEKNES